MLANPFQASLGQRRLGNQGNGIAQYEDDRRFHDNHAVRVNKLGIDAAGEEHINQYPANSPRHASGKTGPNTLGKR